MVATPESRAIAVLKVLNTEPSSYAPKVILLKIRSLASAGASLGSVAPGWLGSKSGSDSIPTISPVRTSMMMPAAPLALKSLMTRASSSCRMNCTRASSDNWIGPPWPFTVPSSARSMPARPLLSIPQNPTTCAARSPYG